MCTAFIQAIHVYVLSTIRVVHVVGASNIEHHMKGTLNTLCLGLRNV